MSPLEACELALRQGPKDWTRAVACQDPQYASYYAEQVDRGPREDTRAAAAREPVEAYLYARHVDQAPHNTTRAGVSQESYWAYFYAVGIDQLLHPAIFRLLDICRLSRLKELLEFD